MRVFPEHAAEYRRRHNPIWPELEAVLKEHGVLSYSIFLQPETHQLFAYVELEDEQKWHALAETEICRKWWAYMKEVMPSHPDNSPIASDLHEVFHI
jgi:L-rhamnose mutarotase